VDVLALNGIEVARVVIVGGGFAGLEAAKSLRHANVQITLIDKQNHHCFQPLLYQVATAALSPADIAWPIRSILSAQENVRVVMGEVIAVDQQAGFVRTVCAQCYPFDYLILATGATHSYFGHDSWAEVAPGLKRIEDAVEIRRRILLAFERAEIEDDLVKQAQLLTFAIIGGGPTGVELAGAVADIARKVLSQDFRRIDPRAARIILLEAGPRLLAAFPDHLAAYAGQSLLNLGVDVRLSTPVTSCDAEGVETSSGRLEAATVLWAAGIRASPAGQWVKTRVDRAQRVEVQPDLSIRDAPNIFAVGDTAHLPGPNGKPIPGVASAAKQMGRYVGRLIAARVEHSTLPGPFAYKHYGDLATIGRKSAIVSIGKFRLRGALAWVFWSVAHIYYLIGARNRFIVSLDWIWEYATFQRGARLINDCRAQPAGSATSAVLPGVSSPETIRRAPDMHHRLRD
jgi:NADH:quinone reductase (non-electrogenic)